MFSRFTEKSIQAIINAQDLAKKYGSEYLGTEHLLLGLIDVKDKENIIKKAFQKLNLDEKKVILAIEETIP